MFRLLKKILILFFILPFFTPTFANAQNEEFKELADTDKLYIYSVLRKLLTLIYQVIRYPNVYPILLVQNYKSKEIISRAFKEIEPIIPHINNIKIEVIN